MKFNPLTKELFTDKGELVKKLECPYRIQWEQLRNVSSDSKSKMCSMCHRSVVDANAHTDESLLEIISKDPEACFKVDINHPELRITYGYD